MFVQITSVGFLFIFKTCKGGDAFIVEIDEGSKMRKFVIFLENPSNSTK
jgi:hypothetical protein